MEACAVREPPAGRPSRGGRCSKGPGGHDVVAISQFPAGVDVSPRRPGRRAMSGACRRHRHGHRFPSASRPGTRNNAGLNHRGPGNRRGQAATGPGARRMVVERSSAPTVHAGTAQRKMGGTKRAQLRGPVRRGYARGGSSTRFVAQLMDLGGRATSSRGRANGSNQHWSPGARTRRRRRWPDWPRTPEPGRQEPGVPPGAGLGRDFGRPAGRERPGEMARLLAARRRHR